LFGEDEEPRHGVTALEIDSVTWGEILKLPWSALKDSQWYPAAFAQTELARVAHYLRRGKVYAPARGLVGSLPLNRLGLIGELGPDRRDIYDGFDRTSHKTSCPALWGHDSGTVTRLAMEPNTYLRPLDKPRKGRPLRDVEMLLPRAGRVMIAERMRLNTQRLSAVWLPEYALSNVWWPFRLREEDQRAEKALVLWLNSTLGIVNTLSYRVPTEGPWVDFKKPSLHQMPVLAVDDLPDRKLELASRVFDGISGNSLLPMSAYLEDDVRKEIDRAIAQLLDLAVDLDGLQQLLGREPVISGKPLGRAPDVPYEQIEFVLKVAEKFPNSSLEE
jgi:hypothetical protein